MKVRKEVGSEAIVAIEPVSDAEGLKGTIAIGIHGNSLTKQLQACSVGDWGGCVHVEVLESLVLSEGLEEFIRQVDLHLGVPEIESLNGARNLDQLHDRLSHVSIR